MSLHRTLFCCLTKSNILKSPKLMNIIVQIPLGD